MTEFTVQITSHGLGINLDGLQMHGCVHFGSKLVAIQDVKPDSIGEKLGLLCGDVLIAINNECVLYMELPQILNLFHSQKLPFTATFERLDEYYESDETSVSDVSDIDYQQESQESDITLENSENNQFPQFLTLHDDDDVTHTSIDICTTHLVNGFIRSYICETFENNDAYAHILVAMYLYNNTVIFDMEKERKSDNINKRFYLCTSSTGFIYGEHEWNIKVLKTDDSLQEIGVISNNNLERIEISEGGITESNGFGAKAIYGNEVILGRNYYASFNEDGHIRINKELLNTCYWRSGDIITIHLNLRNGTITFYLNNKRVRKVISLQTGKIYYPFISFSNTCQ